jgi:hypothetical protein
VESEPPLTIRRAVCRAMFVFDAGREVDLATCRFLARDLVREAPAAGAREAPSSVRIESPPLRLDVPIDSFVSGGRRIDGPAEAAVYEFGAIAVTLCVPAGSTLAELRAAACALAGDAELAAAARSITNGLLARIGASIADLGLSDVVEEHLVFEVTEFDSELPLAELPARCGPELAQILRAEPQDLSAQEIEHATATSVMRTPGDLVLLDWNAAIVLHEEPQDVRAVIELANVQLLEMRFLDRRLDESLHHAYDVVSRRVFWRPVILPDALRESMRRIAQRQVDSAMLFERVSNALKLVGDQYLARVYLGAVQQFELAAWNEANGRKLATLDSIYAKLHDRSVNVRAEMLEWIVILLIFSEIVLQFVR